MGRCVCRRWYYSILPRTVASYIDFDQAETRTTEHFRFQSLRGLLLCEEWEWRRSGVIEHQHLANANEFTGSRPAEETLITNSVNGTLMQ